MANMINFFTYGELMNPKVMEEHGLQYNALFCVSLSAWRLVFNKIPFEENAPPELGLANIVPSQNGLGMMEGVLYEMDERYLPQLDELHRSPKEYQRKTMRFTKHDFTSISGFVYVAREGTTSDNLRPSKAILQKIRSAKKNMQMLYFSRLMNMPTYD
ncbi:MAG: hypothetical protein A3K09_05605 [Nitrospinae bacterium RIFCSPLOWO2_12_FULL_47_7]|nr:MAG: hypothetical protein A3K09_05605 [Nitrospinae bacterium RIFCSPLOWO2_12_FULL_47_7]